MTVCVCALSRFSRVWLFATLWTVPCHAPLSMGFYRSGLPCSPPGDPPDPGIKLESLTSPASAGGFFTTRTAWEAQIPFTITQKKEREKYWSVNLTKHVQNLYVKDHKTLMRDIKDHLNQWRNIPCSWTERPCSRTSIILTLNEGLNTTPIKITAWYFVYTDGLH